MNTELDVIENIKSSFNKHFPNGWMNIGKGRGIGSDTIHISFGLVDVSELSSRISQNDPVFHSFIIFVEGEDLYEAQYTTGSIKINPEVGTHYAMGSVKTKFRKSKGDSDKMTRTFDTFFKRLNVLVIEHESNIYQRNTYSNKWFK